MLPGTACVIVHARKSGYSPTYPACNPVSQVGYPQVWKGKPKGVWKYGDADGIPPQLEPSPRSSNHLPAARTVSPQLEPSPRSLNHLPAARTPYTLHLTPYTSHLTPHTLHLTPYTLHLTPHTVHRTPYTSHLTPYTLHLTGIFLQLEAPNGLRQMYFTVLQTKDGKLSGVGDTALLDISEFELFPRLFK